MPLHQEILWGFGNHFAGTDVSKFDFAPLSGLATKQLDAGPEAAYVLTYSIKGIMLLLTTCWVSHQHA